MIDAEIKDKLLTTRFGQFLKPGEIHLLLKYCEIITFDRDKVILQQGKKSEGIYIIIEGSALVIAKVLGEGALELATLGHGNFIGEISIFENGQCATTVIATSQLTVLFIRHDVFNMFSLFFPEIKYQITRAISYEIIDRFKHLQDKIKKIMEESHMASISLFGAVIQSMHTSTTVTFDKMGFNLNDIKKLELFKLFTDNEFDEIIKMTDLIQAPNHCVLVTEQEFNPVCYIVLQGAVQSSIVHNNKFAKLTVLDPTSLFCTITVIDDKSPTIINYTTCERAILLKISGSYLVKIQKNNTTLWHKFFELIIKSFASMERAADKLDIRLHSEIYNR